MVSYYMGGCQNYGPFLGTLNSRCRIIVRTDPKRDPNFDNHPYSIPKDPIGHWNQYGCGTCSLHLGNLLVGVWGAFGFREVGAC